MNSNANDFGKSTFSNFNDETNYRDDLHRMIEQIKFEKKDIDHSISMSSLGNSPMNMKSYNRNEFTNETNGTNKTSTVKSLNSTRQNFGLNGVNSTSISNKYNGGKNIQQDIQNTIFDEGSIEHSIVEEEQKSEDLSRAGDSDITTSPCFMAKLELTQGSSLPNRHDRTYGERGYSSQEEDKHQEEEEEEEEEAEEEDEEDDEDDLIHESNQHYEYNDSDEVEYQEDSDMAMQEIDSLQATQLGKSYLDKSQKPKQFFPKVHAPTVDANNEESKIQRSSHRIHQLRSKNQEGKSYFNDSYCSSDSDCEDDLKQKLTKQDISDSGWVYQPNLVDKKKRTQLKDKKMGQNGPQLVKFKESKPLSSVSSSQQRPRFPGGPTENCEINEAEQLDKENQKLRILIKSRDRQIKEQEHAYQQVMSKSEKQLDKIQQQALRIDELHSAIEQVEHELFDKQQQLKSQNQKLQQLEKSNKELKSNAKIINQNSHQELLNAREQINQLESQLEQLQQLSKGNYFSENVKKQEGDSSSKSNFQLQLIMKKDDQIENLTNQIDQKKSQIQSIEDNLFDSEKKNRQLETELQDIQSLFKIQQEESEKFRNQVQNLEKENDTVRSEIKRLVRQLDLKNEESERTIIQEKSEIIKEKTALEKLTNQMNDLIGEAMKINFAPNSSIQQQLSSIFKHSVNNFSTAMKHLNDQKEIVEDIFNKKDKEIFNKQQQLNELNSTLKQMQSDFDEQMEQQKIIEKEKQLWKSNYESLKNSSKTNDKDQLNHDVINLESQLLQKDSEIQFLDSKISKYEEQLKNLNEQLLSKQDLKQSDSGHVFQLKQEIKCLEHKLKKCELELNETRNDMRKVMKVNQNIFNGSHSSDKPLRVFTQEEVNNLEMTREDKLSLKLQNAQNNTTDQADNRSSSEQIILEIQKAQLDIKESFIRIIQPSEGFQEILSQDMNFEQFLESVKEYFQNKDTHPFDLEALKSEMEKEKDDIKNHFQNKINNLEEDFKKEKDYLKSQIHISNDLNETSLRDKFSRDLEEQRDDMKRKYDHLLTLKEQEIESKIRTEYYKQLNDNTRKIENEKQQKANKLEEEYKQLQQQLQKDYLEKEESLEQEKIGISEEKQRMQNEIEKKIQIFYNEKQEILESTQKSKLDQIEDQYKLQLETLQHELKQMNAQDINKSNQEWTNLLNKHKKQHEEQVKIIVDEWIQKEKEWNDRKQNLESDLKSQKENSEIKTKDLKRQFAREKKELTQRNERDIKNKEERLKKDIQEVKDNCSCKIEEMKHQLETLKKAQKQEKQNWISKQKAEIFKVKQEVQNENKIKEAQWEREKKQLLQEHEKSISQLEEKICTGDDIKLKINETDLKWKGQISELKQKHQRILDQKEESIKQTYEIEMDKLHNDYKVRIEELRNELQGAYQKDIHEKVKFKKQESISIGQQTDPMEVNIVKEIEKDESLDSLQHKFQQALEKNKEDYSQKIEEFIFEQKKDWDQWVSSESTKIQIETVECFKEIIRFELEKIHTNLVYTQTQCEPVTLQKFNSQTNGIISKLLIKLPQPSSQSSLETLKLKIQEIMKHLIQAISKKKDQEKEDYHEQSCTPQLDIGELLNESIENISQQQEQMNQPEGDVDELIESQITDIRKYSKQTNQQQDKEKSQHIQELEKLVRELSYVKDVYYPLAQMTGDNLSEDPNQNQEQFKLKLMIAALNKEIANQQSTIESLEQQLVQGQISQLKLEGMEELIQDARYKEQYVPQESILLITRYELLTSQLEKNLSELVKIQEIIRRADMNIDRVAYEVKRSSIQAKIYNQAESHQKDQIELLLDSFHKNSYLLNEHQILQLIRCKYFQNQYLESLKRARRDVTLSEKLCTSTDFIEQFQDYLFSADPIITKNAMTSQMCKLKDQLKSLKALKENSCKGSIKNIFENNMMKDKENLHQNYPSVSTNFSKNIEEDNKNKLNSQGSAEAEMRPLKMEDIDQAQESMNKLFDKILNRQSQYVIAK